MAATFSYAQAAKGLPATQPAKPTSAEPNGAGSKPEEQNTDPDAQVSQDPAVPEVDAARETEKTAAPIGKEVEPAAAAAPSSKQDVSGTSSPSVGNSSTAPKDEESSNTVNGTSESTWDKQSQASGTEKPNDASTEETKEKPAEKEKNMPPPKELKAAPLPAVNVWQQRREAQEAKSKVTGNLKPASSATKTGTSKTASTASSTSGEPQQDQPKASLKKKGTDGTPEGARPRSKTEGGKGREDGKSEESCVCARRFRVPMKRIRATYIGSRIWVFWFSACSVQTNSTVRTDASALPVSDASLWPTPQVAQGEEKKKAQEKADKTDKIEKTDKTDKSTAGRSHGKEKWMPVPYVPTAVFNTPLPSTGARRGGRTARGGRDAGRHAPHGAGVAASVDKSASGQPGQGPAAKQTASERGRNEPNTARANSLPAQSRRSNSVEAPAGGAEPRKGADRNRPKGTDDVNAGRQVNGTDAFPRNHRDAKSFTRGQESAAHKGDRNPQLTVDSQNRNGPAQDRRFENGPKSADFAGFYEHKDRDYHNHPYTRERGESRPERGRGGSHRGRGGGHTGHGSQVPYYANPHMQHQSFVHPKSFGYKSSHGFSNPRGVPLRSPSLPNSAAMYGVYPFPADINTMYAAYQPMPAGPMTAVPYQSYMEPFSLMNMISMQL